MFSPAFWATTKYFGKLEKRMVVCVLSEGVHPQLGQEQDIFFLLPGQIAWKYFSRIFRIPSGWALKTLVPLWRWPPRAQRAAAQEMHANRLNTSKPRRHLQQFDSMDKAVIVLCCSDAKWQQTKFPWFYYISKQSVTLLRLWNITYNNKGCYIFEKHVRFINYIYSNNFWAKSSLSAG